MPSRRTNPEHSPCRRPSRRAERPSRSRKRPTFVQNREQANDSAGSRGVFWAERVLPLETREPVRVRPRAVRGRRCAAPKLGHREKPGRRSPTSMATGPRGNPGPPSRQSGTARNARVGRARHRAGACVDPVVRARAGRARALGLPNIACAVPARRRARHRPAASRASSARAPIHGSGGPWNVGAHVARYAASRYGGRVRDHGGRTRIVEARLNVFLQGVASGRILRNPRVDTGRLQGLDAAKERDGGGRAGRRRRDQPRAARRAARIHSRRARGAPNLVADVRARSGDRRGRAAVAARSERPGVILLAGYRLASASNGGR